MPVIMKEKRIPTGISMNHRILLFRSIVKLSTVALTVIMNVMQSISELPGPMQAAVRIHGAQAFSVRADAVK